ncbi:MAG: IS256 family transposase [Nitrospirae bacterium]|nr:IS256 family transposase [Nitrospirota bacterium]
MNKQFTPLSGKWEALMGPDPLTEALRGRIREMIGTLVAGEVEEVLAALPYERTGDRRGYRHGKKTRTRTTGLGPTVIEVPRARLIAKGKASEWHSRLLPRDPRRTAAVEGALRGAYLSGANGRRIRGALSPLLRGAPLSNSAISRIVGRVQTLFAEWRTRPLHAERLALRSLDGIALKVRMARKGISVPVLVALGVRSDGQKEVLDLERLASESQEAWGGWVQGLVHRGWRRPRLGVMDGSLGLRAAGEVLWPQRAVQRCTVHQWRNLERHVPRHAREEVKADDHRIVYAASLEEAQQAYHALVSKWSKRIPKVAKSLEEAGEELLTFSRFPKTQWKSLRTTNAIERLNGEFRRRVKTQGGLPNAQAAERWLFGLLVSGQIRMRRMDGWREMDQIPENAVPLAA